MSKLSVWEYRSRQKAKRICGFIIAAHFPTDSCFQKDLLLLWLPRELPIEGEEILNYNVLKF